MLFLHSAVEKPRKLRRKPTQIRQDLGLCAETQKSSAAKISVIISLLKFDRLKKKEGRDSRVAFNFYLFRSY
ncbi:hypothetical protein ACFX13_033860 [Malus domestica]